MAPVRILIADDHKIVRDGLRALLEREPDFRVVGEASNGREAVEVARELVPDVLITDLVMPVLNGIDATRQIVAEHPQVRVIALSMHSDRRFVTDMLQAGAVAYLRKESAFEELAEAIRAVMSGEVFLGRGITGVVVEGYKSLIGEEAEGSGVLSAREREVLQLLAEGNRTNEIATLLHLSAKTVESHRTNIMKKLDLHSIAELTKFAVREGLTSLDP